MPPILQEDQTVHSDRARQWANKQTLHMAHHLRDLLLELVEVMGIIQDMTNSLERAHLAKTIIVGPVSLKLS